MSILIVQSNPCNPTGFISLYITLEFGGGYADFAYFGGKPAVTLLQTCHCMDALPPVDLSLIIVLHSKPTSVTRRVDAT